MGRLRAFLVGLYCGSLTAALLPVCFLGTNWVRNADSLTVQGVERATWYYLLPAVVPVLVAAFCRTRSGPSARWPDHTMWVTMPLSILAMLAGKPLTKETAIVSFLPATMAALAGFVASRSAAWYLKRPSSVEMSVRARCVWGSIILGTGCCIVMIFRAFTPPPFQTSAGLSDVQSHLPLSDQFSDFPVYGPVNWRKVQPRINRWEIRGNVTEFTEYRQWAVRNKIRGAAAPLKPWPDEASAFAPPGIRYVTGTFRSQRQAARIIVLENGQFIIHIQAM